MLFITNPYLGLTLLSFLYLQFNSKRRINLIFICLFLNGAFNTILKFLFKIPLHKSIYNHDCWYSFPSGHMQYAIAFWGIVWIHTNYNIKFLITIIFLLISSGWEMNRHNYHTPVEMIGAILPAITILMLYKYLSARINFAKNKLILLNIISITMQLLVINIVESPCENYKFTWLWLNVGANLGFGIISLIVQDISEDIIVKLRIRLRSSLFYYISLLFIVEIFFIYNVMNLYKDEVGSLFCGVMMPIMLFLTSKLYQKYNTINE